MFTKLRNRFILTNLGITTVILIFVFTAIYMISAHTIFDRPTPQDPWSSESGFSQVMENRLALDRQRSLDDLLITLIFVGIIVEVLVGIISYFLAENSIQPVKKAYETQKIFIANASHEIKTPLAAIQANLEAADIKDNHWIDNVTYETQKLTGLNNQLLTLARTDTVQRNGTLKSIELATEVQKILNLFQPQFDNKKINFEFKNHTNSTKTSINLDDFAQILNILIDNALKYCDKEITVELKDHSISVKNDGTTIKKKDLSHVFDRFYQSDKSSQGVGLGLAIANTLAERNNWQINVTSGNKYTTFGLNF